MTIKLELTNQQAELLLAAINAEIIKGHGTFLSKLSVLLLGAMLMELRKQLGKEKLDLRELLK